MIESYYPPALVVLWKLLKSNNVDPANVFSRYGLTYTDFSDTKKRIPIDTLYNLWDEAEDLIDSPAFALDAYKFWHPGIIGALGYAWLSSNTLRDAFNRLSRFTSIINPGSYISVEEKGNELVITLDFQQQHKTKNHARSDQALSILLHMCRVNFEEPLNPSKVTLIRSKPLNDGDYFSYFKTNVIFNQKFDSLSFPLAVVDIPSPTSDERLAELNDYVSIQYLQDLDDVTIEDKVKNIIIKNLPSGRVSGEMVAEELAMSYRGLQRKLAETNVSFRKLYEECRLSLAKKYVSEEKLSVTEIAFLLGFGESSSFSRAYRRWTGCSPRMT